MLSPKYYLFNYSFISNNIPFFCHMKLNVNGTLENELIFFMRQSKLNELTNFF